MNGLLIRKNTQDGFTEQEVVGDNTYRLPNSFAPEDVIVDVGANIGAFAHACLIRGCGKVVCFEPEPGCFQMLRANAKQWGGRVECHEKAVWQHSRGIGLDVRQGGYTAMHHTLYGEHRCESVTLDDILRKLPRVRLLKLDCEGAEKPILDAATSLENVEEVVGEIHYRMGPIGLAPTDGWLRRRLKGFGFKHVEVVRDRDPEYIGLFFAKREA